MVRIILVIISIIRIIIITIIIIIIIITIIIIIINIYIYIYIYMYARPPPKIYLFSSKSLQITRNHETPWFTTLLAMVFNIAFAAAVVNYTSQ